VRELRNTLERAFTLCEGHQIKADDLLIKENVTLAESSKLDAVELSLPVYLESIEKQAIKEALVKTSQNKTAAAKLLGVSFRTLRYRLAKLGLSKDDED
jgi:two-component system response regulator PilR (NtrC family)